MGNTPALTPEQITRLDQRAPGWQGVFSQLSESLRARWLPILRAQFRTAKEETREDAIQALLMRYWEKAGAGTLLAGYTPAMGEVETYLSGLLKKYMQTELRKKLKTSSWEGDDFTEAPSTAQPDDDNDNQADASPHKLVIRLTQAPSKLTSAWLTAISHLYETIGQQDADANWSAPPHAPLWQQTQAQMNIFPQGTSACETAMQRAHAEAQVALGAEEDRVREERADHHEGEIRLKKDDARTQDETAWMISQERNRREAACDDHLLWIALRKQFHPLGTPQLADLFGWSTSAAQQYCKRYRNAWPEILPGFGQNIQALYEAKGTAASPAHKERQP